MGVAPRGSERGQGVGWEAGQRCVGAKRSGIERRCGVAERGVAQRLRAGLIERGEAVHVAEDALEVASQGVAVDPGEVESGEAGQGVEGAIVEAGHAASLPRRQVRRRTTS